MNIQGEIISNTTSSRYKPQDSALIASKPLQRSFGSEGDYIEFYLYDAAENLLGTNTDFKNYKPSSLDNINTDGTLKLLELNPIQDIQNLGYNYGSFKTKYNFFKQRITNDPFSTFFIKEISSDRTEIRVSSNTLSNVELDTQVAILINEINDTTYYKDFLLNFGTNKQVVAINIALDKSEALFTVLFKLYEPLPAEFGLKDSFGVVEEIISSHSIDVDLSQIFEKSTYPQLKGPNFNIDTEEQQNNSSQYSTYDDLLGSSNISNSYQSVLNILNNKGIEINVDYTNFENFIHFSSAKERLENFKYKIQLVEAYQNEINYIFNTTSSYVADNIITIQDKINGVTSKFDAYERYLYFDSSSYTWPKTNSTKPYILYNSTSSNAITWFNAITSSASLYDENNQNNLEYTVPEYIRDDEQNNSYLLFLNMIGQHFDNIWIYINSTTDLYRADNNVNEGISKDLVGDILKSLGIKIYSSNSNTNLFEYLIGSSISGSYTYPTGSEYITNLVTSSLQTTVKQDLSQEILKRIYHNVPYLLKSKGTERGLRALISCFGIPDTILRIDEYGNRDKNNLEQQHKENRFFYGCNFEYDFNINTSLSIPWYALNQNIIKYDNDTIVPDTIQLNFNTNKNYNNDQGLFQVLDNNKIKFEVQLDNSASTETGYIRLMMTGSQGKTYTPYITGSFYNGNWWSVMVKREIGNLNSSSISTNNTYSIYIKNNIENKIGFQYSSSIYIDGSLSSSYNDSWSDYNNTKILIIRGHNGGIIPINGLFFSGSINEIRYWSTPLSESAFNKYVLNNTSYEGNNITSSFNDLALRLSLGNNLIPIISGTLDSTHPDQNTYPFVNPSLYSEILYNTDPNKLYTKYIYNNNPNTGISTKTTDKINIKPNQITGSVLSPFIKLNQELTQSYGNNINLLDISLSPTNEINEDIINQLGFFNIDEYIGDPREEENNKYTDLEVLKEFYFNKYLKNYNYYDYIRLIKFFDNSLFKMIKDFTPIKTSLITGINIDSPILERNKFKRSKPNFDNEDIKDINLGNISIINDSSSLYNKITGSKISYFNGDIIGNNLNIYHNYFTQSNENVYLNTLNTSSLNNFIHSDFYLLLNNVTRSLTSKNRKKIELPTNVTYSAELQDSYETLRRHQLPRYEGSKTVSTLFNNYTIGDKSYGKTAAIDKKSLKVAWVKNIPSQSLNFYYKTSINLKYLVDENSSLTELSFGNFNLFEVQNTFKTGEPVIISLSDVQKPSNQVNLDGSKTIFKGGFSYDPILYRENNETLYFTHDNYISSSIGFLGIKALCDDNYRYLSEENNYGIAAPPTNNADNIPYSGKEGSYIYEINGIDGSTTTGKKIAYNYYNSSTWMYASDPRTNLISYGINIRERDKYVYAFNILNFQNTGSGYNTEPLFESYQGLSNGNYYYKTPRTSTYKVKGSIPFVFRGDDSNDAPHSHREQGVEFKIMGIIEKTTTPSDESSWYSTTPLAVTTLTASSSPNSSYNAFTNSITYDDAMNDYSVLYANLDSTISLIAGEYVRFQFYIIDISNLFGNNGGLGEGEKVFDFYINGAPPNKIVNKGYFEIFDQLSPITLYHYTSSYGQLPPMFTSSSTNTLIFNLSSSYLFITGSTFLPQLPSSNYYTPVVDNFSIQKYDLIRIGGFKSPISSYYEVYNTFISGSNTYVTLNKNLDTASFNNAQSFAILRPKPNETSVIINYKKQPGEVSQTILVPNNTNNIKNNIGNIFKSLNSLIQ